MNIEGWQEQKVLWWPGTRSNVRVHLAGARWLRRLFPIVYLPVVGVTYAMFFASNGPLNSLLKQVSVNAFMGCAIGAAVWYHLIIKPVRPGDPAAPPSSDLMQYVFMSWSLVVWAAGISLAVIAG